MKEEYLWDKSGPADEEIEHLEGLLSAFRAEPSCLQIPVSPAKSRLGSWRPALRIGAIAASLLLAAFSIGLYRELGRSKVGPLVAAQNLAKSIPRESGILAAALDANDTKTAISVIGLHSRAIVRKASYRNRVNSDMMAVRERIEGEKAKQELMLAIRIAGEKLNYAQKITVDNTRRLPPS